MMFSERNDKPS